MQGLSFAQVPAGRNVEKWIALWSALELVQDTLFAAGAATEQGEQ